MQTVTKNFESFLGLDKFKGVSQLMRARAVYLVGGAFIVTQIVNQVSMYISYEGFTYDHAISAIACILVALTVIMLRRIRTFGFYASIFSILIVAGTFSSALVENTGINSALIPFFILGIVMNGFICGWRATASFGLAAFCAVWFLWWVSSNYDYTPIFDVEAFADRNFQRAVQASLAVLMITLLSSLFSYNMHMAFSELEEGIEAAQTSDRAKTEFLASMSHELCTPMNGIVGISDILMETDLDEDQRELTELIQRSGDELQTIITTVLLFSQLEANKVAVDEDTLDVHDVLRGVQKKYAPLAASKNLGLSVQISPDMPRYIIGDAKRLGQAFDALVDNAIKFTSEGSVKLSLLSLSQTEEDTKFVFAVQDTGIGIAPDALTRIFERFTQVDGSIKRSYGGTGLGLTVANELLRLMGGEIDVQSTPGKGTIFTASLTAKIAKSQRGAGIAEETPAALLASRAA